MPRILYVQHANPGAFPPVEYSSKILAEAGFEVRLLGVNSQGTETLQLPGHPRIAVEVLPYTAPGWRQKVAYAWFILRCVLQAFTWKPDWIYVSDFMAAPAGLILKRYLGARVIYHEHDSLGDGLNLNGFIRSLVKCRNLLAQRADLIVLPQEQRIRLFKDSTGTLRPVLRVWNCPMRIETFGDVNRQRQPGEPLSVYFHGSLNLDRIPLALIEGAGRSGVPVRLRVVGYETIGSRGTSDTLQKAVEKAGGLVTLELPGPVSRHALAQQMVGMHVGWINFINRLGDINLTHLEGASNKAFDYLAAGLPLIVPMTPGWVDLFVAPGYAKSCNADDVEAIAATLRWFYDHPVEAAEMGRAGQQRTREDWNYERQFSPVLEQMQHSLSCTKPISR
jgi:glycosyltransferase involved in cell wall biosynthesis